MALDLVEKFFRALLVHHFVRRMELSLRADCCRSAPPPPGLG